MSNRSNDQGRAYEYAWISVLCAELKKMGPAKIVDNSSLEANGNAWQMQPQEMQDMMLLSAQAAVHTIISLEPLLMERHHDEILLRAQADREGIRGDVRDIVLQRAAKGWEIGLSIKHNYDTLKHSRLGKQLDFGKEWYDIPCSQAYWEAVSPIFARLERERQANHIWRNMPDKSEKVYAPLVRAFVRELQRAYDCDKTLPHRLMEYLIGIADYYKVIGKDKERVTYIRGFNVHGTLSQPRGMTAITVPRIELPSEIVLVRMKPGKNNYAEVYMNNGWQLSFRIHSAATRVETSLKFDITLTGVPENLLIVRCDWDVRRS